MKSFVAFASLIAVALAAPQFASPTGRFTVPIQEHPAAQFRSAAVNHEPSLLNGLHFQGQNPVEGTNFEYQSALGSRSENLLSVPNNQPAQAHLVQRVENTIQPHAAEVSNSAPVEVEDSSNNVVNRVSGHYSWVDSFDGRTYTIRYTADENGFHPEGDHIPRD